MKHWSNQLISAAPNALKVSEQWTESFDVFVPRYEPFKSHESNHSGISILNVVTNGELFSQLYCCFFSCWNVHGVWWSTLQDIRREILQFPRIVQISIDRRLRWSYFFNTSDEWCTKHEIICVDKDRDAENAFIKSEFRTKNASQSEWNADNSAVQTG